MTALLGLVVEGHGDAAALPLLVRRIYGEVYGRWDVQLKVPPWRVNRNRAAANFDDFPRACAALAKDCAAVLVVIDADDDDPTVFAPELRQRITDRTPDLPVAIAMPVREFEAWFLADLSSLAGRRGVLDSAEDLPDASLIRGAKERLQAALAGTYSETVDQPALAALLDIAALVGKSDSFALLVKELGVLLPHLDRTGTAD